MGEWGIRWASHVFFWKFCVFVFGPWEKNCLTWHEKGPGGVVSTNPDLNFENFQFWECVRSQFWNFQIPELLDSPISKSPYGRPAGGWALEGSTRPSRAAPGPPEGPWPSRGPTRPKPGPARAQARPKPGPGQIFEIWKSVTYLGFKKIQK